MNLWQNVNSSRCQSLKRGEKIPGNDRIKVFTNFKVSATLTGKSVLIPGIYNLEIADRYVVIGCSLNETIACCIRLMITLGHGSIYDEECVDRWAVRNDCMLKHSWLVR